MFSIMGAMEEITMSKQHELNKEIEKCIKIYRRDNSIFDKTISLLNMYLNRNDWPYCLDELIDSSVEFLGSDIHTISSWGSVHFKEDDIVWPDDIPSNFIDDLKKFCIITNKVIQEGYLSLSNPHNLKKIYRLSSNKFSHFIRLIRQDGEFFELKLSNHDIEDLVYSLKEMIGNDGSVG